MERGIMHYKKRSFLLGLISIFIVLIGCEEVEINSGILVSNSDELSKAILDAKPGSEIIMANGDWEDIQIKFYGEGTQEKPITLRAEDPGKVLIKGESDLKLGGKYLIIDGLYFKDGASPSNAVIEFAINNDTLANHSRVTNCVIRDFNKAQRNQQDLWVRFRGRQNQLDHSYLAGKSNRGPTIRVDIEGNPSIKNFHKITNNHFGPRPPKGGPSAETIQLGNSSTSMSPSHTLVADNLFERCNGEVEVISSKSNFNEFKNNVFFKSEGSLVTRHGNYCTIDGNYFIGDEDSSQIGGVRLIGTGHWVTNNYFYNLKGEIFRAPLAVMNGIEKSALNRYIQVTDVVIAYNTWVNCTSPWQFGVGSNVDQKEVLPASEIRSERPIRTIVANNIIYNSKGDEMPIVRHDSIDGILFKNNIIQNQGVSFNGVGGLKEHDFDLTKLEENILVPSSNLPDVAVYNGFDFEQINNDIFGNSRNESNTVGAMNGIDFEDPNIMNLSSYGPDWYNPEISKKNPQSHSVSSTEQFIEAVAKANNGDIIKLTSERYELGSPLKIDKKLNIQSADSTNKAIISYKGEAKTPCFKMNPKGQLNLRSIILQGTGENYAFATLKENMSSLYNLRVEDCEISNFDYILKAYKYSFSESIVFKSTLLKNCKNGVELSAEDDDGGDYNAENLYFVDCNFDGINQNVIDYYRGGYDESTVGGNLKVIGCTFTNCGAGEETGVLINSFGIINVAISDNEFRNNQVKFVARLWGAKNNSESNNTIVNSGRIISEQNLPLKLMY